MVGGCALKSYYRSDRPARYSFLIDRRWQIRLDVLGAVEESHAQNINIEWNPWNIIFYRNSSMYVDLSTVTTCKTTVSTNYILRMRSPDCAWNALAMLTAQNFVG